MELERQTDLQLGTPVDTAPDLRQTALRFIAHCADTRGLSIHTRRAYQSDLRDFNKQLGSNTLPADINGDQILNYVRLMRGRGLLETTIKRRAATLKVFFRWLEHERIVTTSLFRQLDLLVRLPKRLPRALEAREMQFLVRLCEAEALSSRTGIPYENQMVHVAVIVLFATGLRVSELVSLSLADVSMDEASMLVHGKGNRERRVYLPNRRATKVLDRFLIARKRLSLTGHLLVNRNGLPVSAQWIRSRLRSLAERAGLSRRVTPHMLRHTAATQLIEAGVDIRYVQRLLGHSSIATTQIYTHVTDTSLRDQLTRADTLERLRKRM